VGKRTQRASAMAKDFRVKRLGFRHIQKIECVWAGGKGKKGVSGWRLAVGGWGRCRAKVQIGAMLLCKGAKVRESFQVAGGSPRWRVAGPGPVPEPEHLNQIADGRDLGPENGFSRHPPPEAATCHPRMEKPGQHALLPLPTKGNGG
jgi:hypothetical protein